MFNRPMVLEPGKSKNRGPASAASLVLTVIIQQGAPRDKTASCQHGLSYEATDVITVALLS